VFNLVSTYEVSSPLIPLIFVLSPGVDPRNMLQSLAISKGMGDRFRYIALGQGQEGVATRYLEEGIRDGNWVFFANCHLMMSWMNQLEKIVENLHIRVCIFSSFMESVFQRQSLINSQ
jgi:dynein heavy chain, axonemal